MLRQARAGKWPYCKLNGARFLEPDPLFCPLDAAQNHAHLLDECIR